MKAMTQPQPQPDAGLPDDAYPESWGYRPHTAEAAVGAAVDVYLANLSADEFRSLVARIRGGA
jgi:hypothetical protein